MTDLTFLTRGGVSVARTELDAPYLQASEDLIDRLDSHLGALFSSNYEYPGRYTRWDFGFYDPPLMIEARGRKMLLSALNPRGAVLLKIIRPTLEDLPVKAEQDVGNIEAVMSDLAVLTIAISKKRQKLDRLIAAGAEASLPEKV